MKYEIGISTHIGLKRSDNQDAAVAKAWRDRSIVGVFDGMGGHPFGRECARLAADHFRKLARPLAEVSDAAHKAMSERYRYGGTTVAAVSLFDDGMCRSFHVGDSRVYVSRGDVLIQVTFDHGRGNVLHRALGTSDSRGTSSMLRLRVGDKVILCTDGLHGMADDVEISEVAQQPVGHPRLTAGNLVSVALSNGGRDNVTVAVVSCE